MATQRIGDRLIQEGLITDEQLQEALEVQKKQVKRKKIVRVLVDLGFIQEGELLGFFADECKEGRLVLNSILEDFPATEDIVLRLLADNEDMEFIDLDLVEVDEKVASYVPFTQIKRFYAFPFSEDEQNIYVAMMDPFNEDAKDTFTRIIKKKPLVFTLATREQVRDVVTRLELHDSVKELVEKVRREIKRMDEGALNSEQSSIMKLIDVIFETAIRLNASDVHIEGAVDATIIRCRVDGMLQQVFRFDRDVYPPLSSRMKLLAGMDIAEKRKPQDGRFSSVFFGNDYDFRVSSMPTVTGESIVSRILDKSKVLVKLEELGISTHNFKRFNKGIKSPYGIMFVTGPTGSGKTTTLYAALNAIKRVSEKIITVEDPVEYQMPGVNQVMVNEKAGLTFATALKSILRQDPDIIMVGEVRDQDTLRIAIQAALTGHLVFATLHTNDAISSITRLIDMGIESFFISSALAGISAQRLVRRLCQHCIYEVDIPDMLEEELRAYIPENYTFYRSHGCKECDMSGYSGRELLSEVLLVNENMKRMIVDGASKDNIYQEALKDGFLTMFEDGISKALAGKTSLEEVYRVAKLP
ncbi:MAG: GspE/PulE family protein [Campylobacterales bacterium]